MMFMCQLLRVHINKFKKESKSNINQYPTIIIIPKTYANSITNPKDRVSLFIKHKKSRARPLLKIKDVNNDK